MAAKEAPFHREGKDFETELLEASSLIDALLTEVMARRDRLREEVDHLSSSEETLSVEVKSARWLLTGAQGEIKLLTWQATTHKRSTGEVDQHASGV